MENNNCTHPDNENKTKVINSLLCAETTVTVCGICGDQLTPPITNL